MTPPEFGLFLISILGSVVGQWLLKAGALKLGKVNASNLFSHILGIITTPELLASLTCYGLGAVVYILLLTRVKLSVADPAVALSYVFSMLLGYLLYFSGTSSSYSCGWVRANYLWRCFGNFEKLKIVG